MGCSSSTPVEVKDEKKPQAPHQNREKTITGGTETMTTNSSDAKTNKKHMITDAASETIATATTSAVLGGHLSVRYACLSRRGRDPDDLSKPNQDAYSVHEQLCQNNKNNEEDALFGVYDGHGPKGQECSQFVRKRLPQLVQSKLQKNSPDLYQMSLHQAHVECNDELRSSSINDAYSGTTCITLYVHGEGIPKLTICNVGDSRAIMGTPQNNSTSSSRLRAVPLSNDQTPKRDDEATRCRQFGARILTFGQIDPTQEDEDDVEDPPRVWSKHGNYPGVAFTRSIGDAAAEQLGVFSEPEQLTLKLSPKQVKIIVLASDGVFDVMSNQEVMDLCDKHYPHDPMQACRAVVAKSHSEWHVNDDCAEGHDDANYDDMTIICIFLEDDEEDGKDHTTAASAATATTNTDNAEALSVEPEERPKTRVRRKQKTLRNLEEMNE